MFEDIINLTRLNGKWWSIHYEGGIEHPLTSKTIEEYNKRCSYYSYDERKELVTEFHLINDGTNQATNDLLYKKMREDLFDKLDKPIMKLKTRFKIRKLVWKIIWYFFILGLSVSYGVSGYSSDDPYFSVVLFWVVLLFAPITFLAGVTMIFPAIDVHFNDKLRELNNGYI
jgi:hypothetical protein